MASLDRRIEGLEKLYGERPHGGNKYPPAYMDHYFRELENCRRNEAGLEPLPYTEEDRRHDEAFLRETLPAFRASLGWQRKEARDVLDEFERMTLERIHKGKDR